MSIYNNTKPVYLHSCNNYDYSEIKKAIVNIGTELVNGWDTFIPDGNPCEGNGDAYLFALDWKTGSPSTMPIFDINEDDVFDEK